MAKTIIIGEVAKPQPKLKPITFSKVLMSAIEINADCTRTWLLQSPNNYKYIELICRSYGYTSDTDLMFAYNNPDERNRGVLFVGSWNDGITE